MFFPGGDTWEGFSLMAPAICSLSGRIRSLSLSLQRAEAPTWAGRERGEDEGEEEEEEEEEGSTPPALAGRAVG